LWLASGKYAPISLFALAHEWLPGWSLFRYPERLILALNPIIFCLAAREANHWLAKPLSAGFVRGLALVALALLIGAIVSGFLPGLPGSTLRMGFLHSALIGGAFALVALLARRAWVKPAVFAGLTFTLFALDHALIFPGQFWTLPKTVRDENQAVEKIRADLEKQSDQPGAPFRVSHSLAVGDQWIREPATDPVEKMVAADWHAIVPNTQHWYGLATVHGYGSLEPAELMGLWARHRKAGGQRLFDVLGVRYLPTHDALGKPVVRVNTSAWPYLAFASEVRLASSPEEAERWVFGGPSQGPTVLERVESLGGALVSATVKEAKRGPRSFSVRALADGRTGLGVLKWNERFDSRWRVWVNGKPAVVARADRWAMAAVFPVTDTELEVEFRFDEPALWVGAALSFVWLVALCLATFRRRAT
jgi:hypothetical protein